MKTLATFILLLSIATSAQAQDSASKTIETPVSTKIIVNETSVKMKKAVARLYRSKDARVKRELTFTNKNITSKLT